MKILVTGANGYLGARLVQFLAKAGHEVVASVRTVPTEQPVWSALLSGVVVGDLRQPETVCAIADIGAEAIIHTVSLDHKASQDFPSAEVLSANVAPAWALLEACAGKGLRKFFYFSTQQVYGRIGPDRITEDYPPVPVNVYGLTHLMTEQVCNYFRTAKAVECMSIRLSNSFGAPVFRSNNCWWLVVNDFCRSAVEKKQITILSDGSPQRDFIAIADVCRAIGLLIESDTASSSPVYNLGSGATLTILELAHIVAEVYRADYGEEIPIVFADGTRSVERSATTNRKFQYDIDKIQSVGYAPEYSIEDGIRELFHYLRASV